MKKYYEALTNAMHNESTNAFIERLKQDMESAEDKCIEYEVEGSSEFCIATYNDDEKYVESGFEGPMCFEFNEDKNEWSYSSCYRYYDDEVNVCDFLEPRGKAATFEEMLEKLAKDLDMYEEITIVREI